MNQQPYRVELKNIDDTFIKQWKKLWEKAENATIYNSFEWFVTSREISEDKKYHVFVCYKNDELVALIPLQLSRCFGVSVLSTINNEHLSDTPFLMDTYDKSTFAYFFGELFKRNIYIQKIDVHAAALLHTLFPNLFLVLMSVNPKIDLTKDPYESASDSTVSQIKRIMRKNQENLTFKTYTNNLKKHLETMFTLQESSSKNAKSMDIFEKEKNKEYYRSLIHHCARFIRINILSFDDLPITYEFGFLFKDHYTGDQISFHNDYRKLSPGKVLMFYLFDKLKKDSIKSLDMGGGITSYKMSFTDSYSLLYNVYFSSNIFVIIWWKAINKTRRMKQQLFPKKYTRDHEFLFKTFEK